MILKLPFHYWSPLHNTRKKKKNKWRATQTESFINHIKRDLNLRAKFILPFSSPSTIRYSHHISFSFLFSPFFFQRLRLRVNALWVSSVTSHTLIRNHHDYSLIQTSRFELLIFLFCNFISCLFLQFLIRNLISISCLYILILDEIWWNRRWKLNDDYDIRTNKNYTRLREWLALVVCSAYQLS